MGAARYISAVDTAKLIRRALKAGFPATKFSVNTRHSSAINIDWADGPTSTNVEAIIDRYKGTAFDSMSDEDGKPVRYGATYIFTHREFSTEFMTAVTAHVENTFSYEKGSYNFLRKVNQICQVASASDLDNLEAVDGVDRSEVEEAAPLVGAVVYVSVTADEYEYDPASSTPLDTPESTVASINEAWAESMESTRKSLQTRDAKILALQAEIIRLDEALARDRKLGADLRRAAQNVLVEYNGENELGALHKLAAIINYTKFEVIESI